MTKFCFTLSTGVFSAIQRWHKTSPSGNVHTHIHKTQTSKHAFEIWQNQAVITNTYGCAGWIRVSTRVLTAINNTITRVGSKICHKIKTNFNYLQHSIKFMHQSLEMQKRCHIFSDFEQIISNTLNIAAIWNPKI